MSAESTPSVLVLGHPHGHHNREVFLKKLTSVLAEICENVVVVGASQPATLDEIKWVEYTMEERGVPANYLQNLIGQAIYSKYITQLGPFDYTIIRPTPFLITTVYARFSGINHGLFVTQRTTSEIINWISKWSMCTSGEVIVESEGVLAEWDADDLSSEMRIGGTYVDIDEYDVTTKYTNREPIVGFLGSLSERKGVGRLLEAITEFAGEERESGDSLEFHVGGDGPLADTVRDTSRKSTVLEYWGFVPQEEIQSFYNMLSLLVLPTESEGLPNVALEAMACGTPVLATSVGGLPDIIEDGETGFLMEDNDPETIRENIKRALSHPEREQISANARELIEKEYRFESAVKRYEYILGKQSDYSM